MDYDLLFSWANQLIIVFWLLLALLPHHRITMAVVHAPWVTLAIAVGYTLLAIPSFVMGDMPEGGGFGSLDEVMILFGSKPAVLAGWLHYLAFDLFVGAWQVRDARRMAIPHLAVIPCLFLTLMLGPLGLGLYLLVRLGMRRRVGLAEGPL